MRPFLFVFIILWASASFAQDSGRNSGFGLHFNGDMTFSHDNSAISDMNDILYYDVPVTKYYGGQFGLSYKRFLSCTDFFAEVDLSIYYLGQKEQRNIHLGNILKDYDAFLVNTDMDEWGSSLLVVGGHNLPVGDHFSIDFFTGPEIRCAFSCSNDYDKIGVQQDLLIWHFYRWLMRWKLGTGVNYRHVGMRLYGSYDVTCKSRQVHTRDFTLSLGLNYLF